MQTGRTQPELSADGTSVGLWSKIQTLLHVKAGKPSVWFQNHNMPWPPARSRTHPAFSIAESLPSVAIGQPRLSFWGRGFFTDLPREGHPCIRLLPRRSRAAEIRRHSALRSESSN